MSSSAHPDIPFAAATTGPTNLLASALFRDTRHTVSRPGLGGEPGGEVAGAGALEVLAAGEVAFALDGAEVFGAGCPL
jgi:hypothetical protein